MTAPADSPTIINLNTNTTWRVDPIDGNLPFSNYQVMWSVNGSTPVSGGANISTWSKVFTTIGRKHVTAKVVSGGLEGTPCFLATDPTVVQQGGTIHEF
jgi:hypothetical protein